MSIKPVDFNTLVPKVQELTKIRQIENDKTKIQLQQNFVQQENKIERDLNRVKNADKSEETKIDVRHKKQDKNQNSQNQKNKKGSNQKQDEKDENNKLGKNIDIRI